MTLEREEEKGRLRAYPGGGPECVVAFNLFSGPPSYRSVPAVISRYRRVGGVVVRVNSFVIANANQPARQSAQQP